VVQPRRRPAPLPRLRRAARLRERRRHRRSPFLPRAEPPRALAAV